MQWSISRRKSEGCTKQKFSAAQSELRNESTGVDSFVLFGGEGPKSQNFKFQASKRIWIRMDRLNNESSAWIAVKRWMNPLSRKFADLKQNLESHD